MSERDREVDPKSGPDLGREAAPSAEACLSVEACPGREARAMEELVEEYRSRRLQVESNRICFDGVSGRDVYNITAPFEDQGERVIAGRVESRDTEYSDVFFFVCRDGVWVPRPNTRVFRHLQDPFVSRAHGQLVFGGVEVWPNPGNSQWIDYRTVFYRGTCIDDLRLFAVGPQYMKDIRLVELRDGRIAVFVRPQGGMYGRGRIGFTIIDQLDDLTPWEITRADLIPDQFIDEEWGGPNELHVLSNGLIGVLGHIARSDAEGNKHYCSAAFAYDSITREASPLKVIATRDDFAAGDTKRPDLRDVIFSGGLIRRNDGTAELYAGVSDAEAHVAVIPDPFAQYESMAAL
jgi:hypothetical protein